MLNKENIDEFLENIFNNENSLTLKTGFHDLDAALGAIDKNSLIVIGSRPSMGKTAFMSCLMANLLSAKQKCLFFSIELSSQMFIKRLITQMSEVEYYRLDAGELSDKDMEKITIAFENMKEFDFGISDIPLIGIDEIEEKIKEIKPKYVFIDYLQLIDMPKKKTRSESIEIIMNQLKKIAKEEDCMMFITSQLSRAVEGRYDKHPMLSDLRDSGSIETIADVVMFIYREEYYDRENPTSKDKAEIIIAKNKFGPTFSISLLFRGSILKFLNPLRCDAFQ